MAKNRLREDRLKKLFIYRTYENPYNFLSKVFKLNFIVYIKNRKYRRKRIKTLWNS